MRAGSLVLVCAAGVLALGASTARAQEQAQPPALSLRTSFKGTGLFARLPDDPVLFPDRGSAEGFGRLRLEPTARIGSGVSIEAAVEQRVRAFSSESGASGILPAEGSAPFRIRQLDWQVASGSNGEWRAEVDRAAMHATAGAVNLTVGRQAIGWGRGVLFGAIDLFSPFTPLEADREWRRGVDAVRADVKFADRVSLDSVAAFGEDIDHSAFATRLRGYAGKADLELVGGRRARDTFAGASTSAAIGDAEAHAEIALFDTNTKVVTKAVVGGSYRVPLGSGLLVYVEYHYSGFGASSAAGILPLLADPSFRERYLRGDTQILGRHAVAALASYEFSPEWSASFEWLQSPVDGSGVLVPSATRTLGDRLSLLVSGYVPFGKTPAGPVLGSDFGGSPIAAFVQLRCYY